MDDDREDDFEDDSEADRQTGGLPVAISIIVLLVIVGVACLAVGGLYWEAVQINKRTSHEHHVEKRQAKPPQAGQK